MKTVDLTVRAAGRVLLDRVSIEVQPGELVALTGPSGAGKTVLSQVLLGVFEAHPMAIEGQIHRADVAWLPQHGRRSLDPLARSGTGVDPQILDAVGLAPTAADLYPHQLSGGMAKRVALARALSLARPFLIADEPASGVDAPLQEQVHKQLRQAADRGVGVLWITHDLRAATALADRCIGLRDGRVVAIQQVDEQADSPAVTDPGKPLMEFRGVRFSYHSWGRQTPILHDIDLCIRAGERVALVGPSGSGKSTLARLAVGLLRPNRGEVRVLGAPARPGLHIQLLTQDPRDLLIEDLPLRALLRRSARLHGREPQEVDAALDAVGLLHRSEAVPAALSGGELRRAGIARCTLARAPIWVADEPLSGLDAPLRLPIGRVLFDAVGPRGGLLFITHDLRFARRTAHRILPLHDGRIE